MKVLVTGGAGFIGSAFVRYLVNELDVEVVNVDKLTYAANMESLASVAASRRYRFEKADITDRANFHRLLEYHQPDAIAHLAAESHVDKSIDASADFVSTNLVGTFSVLEAALAYWRGLDQQRAAAFRLLHISTDEVFGDLGEDAPPVSEAARYAPNSPYAATKAGSDHLARAWHRTYGLPVIITHCANNFGPYQFPEKLMPHMILRALAGETLPVYGDGRQIRDWIYVDDHVKALWLVLEKGRAGDSFNIGAGNERTNLDVVSGICRLMDERVQRSTSGGTYAELIEYVSDRPGHDSRYALDTDKIGRELDWSPIETFSSGLAKTVDWYLDNKPWWQRVLDGSYRLDRIGTVDAV